MTHDPARVNRGDRRDGPHPRPPVSHAGTAGIDPMSVVVPWGRHRGRRLGDLPTSYLVWLADSSDSPTWRALAAKALGADEGEDDTDPDPTSAAVVLPGVAYRWRSAMTATYGDDPLAMEVVAAGLTVLKVQSTEYTRRPWYGGEAA